MRGFKKIGDGILILSTAKIVKPSELAFVQPAINEGNIMGQRERLM